MKRINLVLALAVLLAVVLTGCTKRTSEEPDVDQILREESSESTTEEITETTTEDPYALEEGMMYSRLTGLPVEEEKGNSRPYAIMFNNIQYASPQSGTSQAAVIYEALAEGGITRMMGIFEDFDAERIGSIRSARHYFVSFADEYDAIFVHYGHTKYALSKISELKVDNLSGLSNLDTVVFYRDKSIKAPHNAFTSYDGIQAGMEKKGYRTELREGIDNHFSFHLEDTEQTGGKPAEKVTLGFSSYTSPYFVYDSSRKEYKRYQFQKEHIDKTTGEVLTFKNLIIQFVKEWDIDKNGYQTMELGNTSGKGYYITDGTYTEITWKKNESTKKMNYYDGNGDRLVINPGKTYIGVFPEKRSDKLVISEHE